MTENVYQIQLNVSADTAKKIKALADSAGVSDGQMIRRAIAILLQYSERCDQELLHLGVTKDPDNLDVIFTNILRDDND